MPSHYSQIVSDGKIQMANVLKFKRSSSPVGKRDQFWTRWLCYFMCSKRRREGAKLRGCQFDEKISLCYSHKGPVKKGNRGTFAQCRIFRSLAEELGHCVSHDTPNEIPREFRQTIKGWRTGMFERNVS